MTKQEFIKLYDTLQTLGNISHVGMTPVQSSLVSDSYTQIWNLLTDNGQESLNSAAGKLGLELV